MATVNRSFENAIDQLARSQQNRGFLPSSYYYIDPKTGAQTRPMLSPSAPVVDLSTGRTLYTPASTTIGGSHQSQSDPYSVIRKVKNPQIEAAATSALERLGATDASSRKTLQEYLDESRRVNDRARASLASEQSALEDIYQPGGLRARLSGEIDRYGRAVGDVGRRAYSEALRNLGAQQMGAGLTGASSYLGRQASDQYSGINIPLQRELSARRMALEGQVKDYELAGLGRSGDLSQRYLAGLVAPIDVQNSYLRNYLGNLGQIGAVDQANTFYGLQKPVDAGYGTSFQTYNNPLQSGGSYPLFNADRYSASGLPYDRVSPYLNNPDQDRMNSLYGQLESAGWSWARDPQGNLVWTKPGGGDFIMNRTGRMVPVEAGYAPPIDVESTSSQFDSESEYSPDSTYTPPRNRVTFTQPNLPPAVFDPREYGISPIPDAAIQNRILQENARALDRSSGFNPFLSVPSIQSYQWPR